MIPPQPAERRGGNAGTMEVLRVIDPGLLDDDAREVWDWLYPDGFWAGAPHTFEPHAAAHGRPHGTGEAVEGHDRCAGQGLHGRDLPRHAQPSRVTKVSVPK